MNIEDFDHRYRFRMVQAYSIISGVLDVYSADREQIDEGFRYVLEARNLRRTHELYLIKGQSQVTAPERRGPERRGPDYPPEWDNEPLDPADADDEADISPSPAATPPR